MTATDTANKLPTFVINRGKDEERWNSVHASLAPFPELAWQRIEAIDGHAPGFDVQTALPDIFGKLAPIPDNVHVRGTNAIAMSHALCWREIANGDSYFGLVLEDDVRIGPRIHDLREALVEGQTPDIMFVNPRMHRHLTLAFPEGGYGIWTPVDVMIAALARRLPQEQFEGKNFSETGILKAPGGDAYVLTRPAAQRLLDHMGRKTKLGHVDQYLHFVAAGQEVFQALPHLPRTYKFYADAEGLEIPGGIYQSPCVQNVKALMSVSTRLARQRKAT